MKNIIKCENCGFENESFKMNCQNCNSILRERIVNIDLWSTIWKIIESPSKAFRNIIYAEHKNFLIITSLLLFFKVGLTSFFLHALFSNHIDYSNYLFLNVIGGIGAFAILILIVSIGLKYILKSFGISSRFKDNYSLLIYSHIPLLIALFFLFPVEYALFGKHWLSFNPSPFLVRPSAAFVLAGVEILLFIWSLILLMIALFLQSKSRSFSIIVAVVVEVIIILWSVNTPYF